MEPEDFEQGEQPYRENPRNAFNSRLRRQGAKVFNESFGTEIDFEEVQEEFKNIEALEEIASTQVNKPSFPIITFMIAVVLDLLDFADFTGVGYFVMVVIKTIFSIILLYLMMGKLNTLFTAGSKAAFRRRGRSGLSKSGKKRRGTKNSNAQKGLNKIVKKTVGKYLSKRMAAIIIVNFIPFIGILASNAFFVYLAHNKQTKIAQKYISLVTAVTKVLDRHERQQRREE